MSDTASDTHDREVFRSGGVMTPHSMIGLLCTLNAPAKFEIDPTCDEQASWLSISRGNRIGSGPQTFAGGSGQFFHIFQRLITGLSWLHPSKPLFDQFMGNLSPIRQQNVSSHPTLSIPFQVSHDDFTVGDVGSRRMFRLFAIRLLQFGTIHIAKIDHVLPALMMDGQAISLVNREDSCNEVRPCDCRTDRYENETEDGRRLSHDSVCYPPHIIPPMNSRFCTRKINGSPEECSARRPLDLIIREA